MNDQTFNSFVAVGVGAIGTEKDLLTRGFFRLLNKNCSILEAKGCWVNDGKTYSEDCLLISFRGATVDLLAHLNDRLTSSRLTPELSILWVDKKGIGNLLYEGKAEKLGYWRKAGNESPENYTLHNGTKYTC